MYNLWCGMLRLMAGEALHMHKKTIISKKNNALIYCWVGKYSYFSVVKSDLQTKKKISLCLDR